MIIDNIENCYKIIKLRRSKTNSKIKAIKIIIQQSDLIKNDPKKNKNYK